MSRYTLKLRGFRKILDAEEKSLPSSVELILGLRRSIAPWKPVALLGTDRMLQSVVANLGTRCCQIPLGKKGRLYLADLRSRIAAMVRQNWRAERPIWRSEARLRATTAEIGLNAPQNIGRQTRSAACAFRIPGTRYLRLAAAVRSADSLTIPAAPHQFEPTPVGLIGVKLPSNLPVKSPVNALQLPFERLVSE